MLLGVNAYSNNAGMAAFDGEILVVQEEERFNRKKKTHDFPDLALLNAAPDGWGSEIEAVCFPWDPRRFVTGYLRVLADEFPRSLQLLLPASSREDNSMLPVRALFRLRGQLRRHFNGRVPKVHFVQHHRAHAALAFYGSPFDEALILVADAFGDKCSISAFVGEGDRITDLYENRLMDSLGVLYSCVTLYLGYKTVLDEGKVMALASYGSDRFVEDFKQIVKLVPDGELIFDYSWLNYHRAGEIRPFTRKFESAFGPPRKPGEPLEQRHKDLARALQATVEDALLHLVAGLKRRTGMQNLAYAGGVAMNCVAAGRLARELGFDGMYIPPCPDDGGVQLGAAMWHHCMTLGHPRGSAVDSAYHGASYTDADVDRAIGGRRCVTVSDPAHEAAALIAEGRVVGWFQGRMEVGPRALGNRSILADPRRKEMPDHLNAHVKHREMYRPYAPSVLEQSVTEWYPESPYSPFMSFTSAVSPQRADAVPGVTHVDGTARIQSVRADVAPLYHRLISSFASRTGVPLVLNTSLNDKEPICCSPWDAVKCFDETQLDALFLGDRLLFRGSVEWPLASEMRAEVV